jgi:hypothetical protein
MAAKTPTVEEVRSWPVTVDVKTAGRAWGIGRDQAYTLARKGLFPVPVLRLGRYLRVTRASVLEALGIDDPHHGHEDVVDTTGSSNGGGES